MPRCAPRRLEQEPEWHPEGDVWTHTLMVIDQARTRNDDLDRPRLVTVMLGAVCHDLGKPATTAVIDGRIRSLDHEEQGVAPALSLLDRLNVHTIDGYDVRGQVVGIVVAVAWIVLVLAVTSALSAVFKAALYRWAVGLPVDPAFDAGELTAAFRRR